MIHDLCMINTTFVFSSCILFKPKSFTQSWFGVNSLLFGVCIPQWWWPCLWRAQTSRSGRCWQPEVPVSVMEQKCLEQTMEWSSDPPKTITVTPSGQYREATGQLYEPTEIHTGTLKSCQRKKNVIMRTNGFKIQHLHKQAYMTAKALRRV